MKKRIPLALAVCIALILTAVSCSKSNDESICVTQCQPSTSIEAFPENETGSYEDEAYSAATIVKSINRASIQALVSVSLLDFNLDGCPELLISTDKGGGRDYINYDVYDLQKSEAVFSFKGSGASADYKKSLYLYCDCENTKFFIFKYAMFSGNSTVYSYCDRLEIVDGGYRIVNIFSSTEDLDHPENSIFAVNGVSVDKASFDESYADYFAQLTEIEYHKADVKIDTTDEWNDLEYLANAITAAMSNMHRNNE